MAHLGHPWQTETCTVVRKHPNVYTDLSKELLPPVLVLGADDQGDGVERARQDPVRVDYPIATARETADHIRRVNDDEAAARAGGRLEEIIRGPEFWGSAQEQGFQTLVKTLRTC